MRVARRWLEGGSLLPSIWLVVGLWVALPGTLVWMEPVPRPASRFPMQTSGTDLPASLIFLTKVLAKGWVFATVAPMRAMSESGRPPHFNPRLRYCLALAPDLPAPQNRSAMKSDCPFTETLNRDSRDALEPQTLNTMNSESSIDRKSTRLNSSHRCISYAVFCL